MVAAPRERTTCGGVLGDVVALRSSATIVSSESMCSW